ncbi:MAG TPA: LpqB family beta-propeller domain-containing protein [Gemmatimonadales bacterium]|nr:LpqB family beta-propeller domain-containing protein [Gemmatimonadales bacterium]
MRLWRIPPLAVTAALTAACDGTDPSNAAPAAAFTFECVDLECSFENRSTDSDGSIESSAWDFGDGGISTAPNPTYAYGSPGGQFMVTLVVTDDDGAAATAAWQVTVSQINDPPLVDFAVACTKLACTFTDLSTDPDAGGSIVSRTWNFGDGQTSVEPNPVHTYQDPGGLFTVTLTVTDNDGMEATAAKQVAAGGPDRSGSYERETPHSAAGRHSRYVINPDGTFVLQDDAGSDTTTYTGRWVSAGNWGGWVLPPGAVIILDFDGFETSEFCGEAYGAFLMDSHLGIAYCGPLINAGLEEGVYTSAPDPGNPDLPPPQAGQIAFVRNGRIYLASTDGSGLVQLTDGPIDADPAWSPDGARSAFTRASGGTNGVFIMDADGSNVVQRTTAGSDPSWSPDGEWIAFTCSTAGGGHDICTVKADDATAAPVNITRHFARVSEPAWSPDGTRIAFISDAAMYDFWFDIWLVAPDGTQLVALTTHTPTNPNPEEQHQPAWSSDGQRIAHVECPWAWNICSSSVIEVMNADGSGAVRLAAASGFASPTWSPDGQVIAFASSNVIHWVSADGSRRGRIIEDGHSPSWRP